MTIIDSLSVHLAASPSLDDSISLAKAINLYGESLANKNENDSAIVQFLKVLSLFPEKSMIDELGYTHNNLGTIYSRNNDPGKAVPHIQRAIEIFSESLGPTHLYIGVIQDNLAMQYGILRNYDQKITGLQKADSILALHLPEDNTRRLKILRELSLLHQHLGDEDLSEIYISRLIMLSKNLPDHRTKDRLDAFDAHAAWTMRSDDHDLAESIALYKKYIDQLEEDFNIGHPDLRDMYNNYALLLMEQESHEDAKEYFSRAFQSQFGIASIDELPMVDEVKNPSLIDLKLITNHSSLFHKSNDQPTYKNELKKAFQYFMFGDSLADQIKTEVLNDRSRHVIKDEHRGFYTQFLTCCWQLYELTKNKKFLSQMFNCLEKMKRWELIEKMQYRSSNQILKSDVISLSDVERYCTSHDEQWIHYFPLAPNAYGVLYVDADTTFVVSTGKIRDSIHHAVDTLLIQFQNKETDFHAQAYFLYDQLVKPVIPFADQKSLIITPYSKLRNLPFEALIIERDKHDPGAEHNYLLFHFDIRYQTSATFSLLTNASERIIKDASFYAPNYATKELKLDWSKTEVQSAQDILRGALVSDDLSFMTEILSRDWVHFSGHTITNLQSVDSTYLLLEKDTLFLREMMSNTSASKMIVLSSCESAIGKSTVEALMGPAYGFAMAGVPNSISTLWPVSDRSSAELFGYFYTQFNSAENSASALTSAKKIYLENSPKQGRHPYYWANAVYYGHPLVLQKMPDDWIKWIFLALILFGIVIILRKYFHSN